MTHRECPVDRPFPVTWLGNVWEPSPPPRSTGLSRLFNPCFPGLKSDTVMLSHGPVTGHSGSHSSTSSSTTTSPPSAILRLEHRVSVFPFLTMVLSLAGCLCPLCFQLELLKLCFFEQVIVRVVLYLALWPARLAASVVAHWGGNRTVPWPLAWDSWPPLSFALPDQPPPPDHCENHLIWVDSIPKDPLGLMWDVPWVPTTLMTLSLQLWS